MSKHIDRNGAHALPLQPNLEHLKNEAKDRLSVLRQTEPKAKLADVQLTLARDYGFASWRALKDEIERRSGGIDNSAALSAYAGFYRHAPGVVDNHVITVTARGEQLFLQAIAGPMLVLSRQTDGWFITPGLPTRYGFTDLKDGQAATLCIAIDGWRAKLARIDAAAAAREKAANAAAVVDNARPRQPVEISAAKLEKYAGHYVSPLGRAIEVAAEAGHLFMRLTGLGRIEIFPESEANFFFSVLPAKISFLLEEGQVRVLLFRQQDGVVTYFYPAPVSEAVEAAAATEQRLAEQRRPRVLATVDPALFADYAGRYRVDERRSMTVTAEDGHLFAQITDQDRYEIYPETQRDFFFTVVAAQITFFADVQGRVGYAVLHQHGREIPLTRMDMRVAGGTHD